MPKRILVIDDDEEILDIVNIVLQQGGYEVILSNISDAAEHLEEILPDLIILDVRIHGSYRSGAEICEAIKLQYATNYFPVILLSAEADLRVLAMSCGADGFVNKPFDIDELLLQVDRNIR